MDEFENIPIEQKEPKIEHPMTPKEPRLKWNWGAFMLTLPFAIGNCAYLGLLCLVPGLNFIWCFFAGAEGARWAYESGMFANIDEFNGAMESWNRAGKIMFIVCIALILFYVFIGAALIGSLISLFANIGF